MNSETSSKRSSRLSVEFVDNTFEEGNQSPSKRSSKSRVDFDLTAHDDQDASVSDDVFRSTPSGSPRPPRTTRIEGRRSEVIIADSYKSLTGNSQESSLRQQTRSHSLDYVQSSNLENNHGDDREIEMIEHQDGDGSIDADEAELPRRTITRRRSSIRRNSDVKVTITVTFERLTIVFDNL